MVCINGLYQWFVSMGTSGIKNKKPIDITLTISMG
jgi:hypothetical protein